MSQVSRPCTVCRPYRAVHALSTQWDIENVLYFTRQESLILGAAYRMDITAHVIIPSVQVLLCSYLENYFELL